MIVESYKDIEIQAGGLVYETVTASSVNISTNDPTMSYNIISTGTPSMAASYTVSTTGTPFQGHKVIIKYEATVDFNGNTLTLMGTTIDVAYEAKKFIVESIYDGTVWNTVVIVDFDQPDIVIADSIKDNAVTVNKILDGAITGAKILDGAITSSKLDPTASMLQSATVIITSAEILTAYSNPIDIVPGVGILTHQVISASLTSDTGGITPYATNTIAEIITNSGGLSMLEADVLGFSTGTTKTYIFNQTTPIINQNQTKGGESIKFKVRAGNPTAGDSNITIKVFYITS